MGETNGLVPTLQMRPLRPPHPTLPLLAHTGRSAADASSDPPEVSLLSSVSTDCFPEAAGPRAWLCLTATKAGWTPSLGAAQPACSPRIYCAWNSIRFSGEAFLFCPKSLPGGGRAKYNS